MIRIVFLLLFLALGSGYGETRMLPAGLLAGLKEAMVSNGFTVLQPVKNMTFMSPRKFKYSLGNSMLIWNDTYFILNAVSLDTPLSAVTNESALHMELKLWAGIMGDFGRTLSQQDDITTIVQLFLDGICFSYDAREDKFYYPLQYPQLAELARSHPQVSHRDQLKQLYDKANITYRDMTDHSRTWFNIPSTRFFTVLHAVPNKAILKEIGSK